MQIIFDRLIFLGGWLVAQVLFYGYEAHVPLAKRLSKLLVMGVIFVVVHITLGRPFFYGLLALMTLGIAILHGYWFQHCHGIHWRTAEPRTKYLQLIGEQIHESTTFYHTNAALFIIGRTLLVCGGDVYPLLRRQPLCGG